jgi:hypothetical protein
MRSLNSSIRSRIRAVLAVNPETTCSDLVWMLGMDPRSHKGTIHAIMVEMEQEGILWASMKRHGQRLQRNRWSLVNPPRKRDRIRAILMGV